MRSTRLWFWITLGAAILCALGCAFTWVDLQADTELLNPSFAGAITGMFFLGGFAISLAVDALILRLRKAPIVRTGEVVVLIVLGAVIVLLLLVGIAEELIAFAFFLWPLSVLFAIAVSIVLVVGNSRNPGSTELATAAFEAPAVPQAPATPEPQATTPEGGASPYGPAKD